MKILFVCTGNTCRSPMAEAIARNVFADRRLCIEVASAGIFAYEGDKLSSEAAVATQKKGINIKSHRVIKITPQDMKTYDLILTMTENHKAYLLDLANTENFDTSNIYTLTEYVYGNGEYALDIPDPFGRGQSAYDDCCNTLINVFKDFKVK